MVGTTSVGLAHRSQRHQKDAVGKAVTEFGRHLQRETGFAHSSGSRERDQSHLWTMQEQAHVVHLLFPTQEGRRLYGQIVGLVRERLESGKLGGQIRQRELVDVFGAQQVFEGVFTQVLQARSCGKLSRTNSTVALESKIWPPEPVERMRATRLSVGPK